MADRLLSVGLVVGLAYMNPWLEPYGEFQRMQHPHFRAPLAAPDAERLAYGARTVTGGGLQGLPQLQSPAVRRRGCILLQFSSALANAPPSSLPALSTPAREGYQAAEAWTPPAEMRWAGGRECTRSERLCPYIRAEPKRTREGGANRCIPARKARAAMQVLQRRDRERSAINWAD
ncbi:hypothetical protein DFH09DRAFT_1399558 [Mycena vulgaris]|nr:hypothetical protein DFH09DRAFT_1399558 [Mycena vulgaris]